MNTFKRASTCLLTLCLFAFSAVETNAGNLGSQLSCVEGGPIHHSLRSARNQLRNSASMGSEEWTDREFLSGVEYFSTKAEQRDSIIPVVFLVSSLSHPGFQRVAKEKGTTIATWTARTNFALMVVSLGALVAENRRNVSAHSAIEGISLQLPEGDIVTFESIGAEIQAVLDEWNTQPADWRIAHAHSVIRKLNALIVRASQFAGQARRLYEDQIYAEGNYTFRGLRLDQLNLMEEKVDRIHSGIEKVKNEIAAEAYVLAHSYCGLQTTSAWVDGNRKELGEMVSSLQSMGLEVDGAQREITGATTEGIKIKITINP